MEEGRPAVELVQRLHHGGVADRPPNIPVVLPAKLWNFGTLKQNKKAKLQCYQVLPGRGLASSSDILKTDRRFRKREVLYLQ